MFYIYPVNAGPIPVDINTVLVVAGPYPSDVALYSYVHASVTTVAVTLEPIADLITRVDHALIEMGVQQLVQFQRPDNTPVWIKASAVAKVVPPLPMGQYAKGSNAVLLISDMKQAVAQPIEQCVQAINAAGGRV